MSGGGAGINSTPAIELLRLTSTGSPDTTFRGNGIERAALGFLWDGIGPIVESVALEPDGRILIAGLSNGGFQIAAFTSDGHFDRTFGTFGLIDLSGFGIGSIIVGGGRIITVNAAPSNPSLVKMERFFSMAGLIRASTMQTL